jgi:nicotinamide-nucleotide amidase
MEVPLVRDEAVLERVRAIFAARGRPMAASNERQADVPLGAVAVAQEKGTAPGLICPVAAKVVYAVPGVPHEMREMVARAVLPDLRARAGTDATIASGVLGTWGLAESELAEVVGPRLRALDAAGANPTIAFLARGIEGIKIRVTAKAPTEEEARAMVDAEHARLRELLGTAVFGTDDETMEHAAGKLLENSGLTLGLAESMTGGLAASRVVDVEGSSGWFLGAVVAYQAEVKFEVLGVREGPVVTEEAARQMAEGACKVLGADVGLSITGVAGPVEQEGKAVGTTFFGVCLDGRTDVTHARLPGDRDGVRQLAVISVFDLLRRRLLERAQR